MNTKIIEWSARRIHARRPRRPGPAVVQGADAEEAADAGRVDRDRGGSRDAGGAQHEGGAQRDRDEERVLVQNPAQAGLDELGHRDAVHR